VEDREKEREREREFDGCTTYPEQSFHQAIIFCISLSRSLSLPRLSFSLPRLSLSLPTSVVDRSNKRLPYNVRLQQYILLAAGAADGYELLVLPATAEQ
jgi:hypothetical protein